MIACSKCKQEKELTAYSYRNKSKGIRHVQCKECIKVEIHNHYINNKEAYLKRVREWVDNNRSKRKSNHRNSYAKNKGYERCDCCTTEEIKLFLSLCPVGCDVDHIKTRRQQGKHCLKNIRYLETSTHCRKSQWERYNT